MAPLFQIFVGEKKSLTFAFRQGLKVPDDSNYIAEFISIAWALVANGRGANLPYFGKQTNI